MAQTTVQKILAKAVGRTEVKVGEVLDTYILRRGIMQGNHSYSTAIGLVKSLITMGLIVSVNSISRRLSEVSLW